MAGIKMLANTVAMTTCFPIAGIPLSISIFRLFTAILNIRQTSKTGYYEPTMIAGAVISAVAGGLMVGYDVNTSTGYWMASLILSGAGFGLSAQQCMMVPQTILKSDDISLGTSVIMFSETIAGTVFLAVCENVFATKLVDALRVRAPTVDPHKVITHGASSLSSAMGKLYDAHTVSQILQSYSSDLRSVWVIGVVLGSLSVIGAVCTEWVSVKKHKKAKSPAGEDSNTPKVENKESKAENISKETV